MVSDMATSDTRPTFGPGGALTLSFDASADGAVGEHRSSLAGFGRDDRLAALTIGGGFLLTALLLPVLLSTHRHPGATVVVLYVVVYALVSRVEFEVFTGASVPTELVFVGMLFVLPLRLVPLCVAAGLALGSSIEWARGRISAGRIAVNLIGCWHAVGPVLVLSLAGEKPMAWARWPVYLAALAAQFGVELASLSANEWIARRTSPGALLPHLARTQIVDAALAPVGLVFAFAAPSEPYTILFVLPLVGLLRVFSSERRLRIDNALELSAAYRGTAFLLGDVVEADDAYTGLHSRDVVELSIAVADELGLSAGERRDTEFVALLHDVGKIRIPSEIINKPGRLTPEERAVMQTHTIEGEQMLEQVGGLLGSVGRVVRSCHERWDGDGYPDGLAGEKIPLVARIVSCCDAFSAMTTDRSYRAALPLDVAVGELRANAGTQFDPQVVDALIAVTERGLSRPTD
jgi:HD-GYP domain-containing protein (c-di-GMP phosphodiesterase class II)